RLDRFRRSGRGYVACCPAHDDRHPSFYMPDGRPWGKCFACGHFVTWWQVLEQRGLTGRQVIEELARMAGIPPLSSGDPEKARQAAEEARQAEEWWQSCREALWRPDGADVLAYLRSRGYGDDLIREMDLGIHLGASAPSGLKLPPLEYRLLIPARSRGGRIIGFAGRRIDGGEPKYQYSNGLQKSVLLWGQYRLRKSQTPIVVVEGVLDTESLAASGVDGVVALGGSKASGEQTKLLSSFSRVVLALDLDQAGRAGTMDLVRVLAAGGTKTYVADLNGAKDPDELLRRDGPEAVRKAFRRAVSGHRWLVRQLAPGSDATDQERDAALEKALDFAEVLILNAPVAASEVIQEISHVYNLSDATLAEAVERLSEVKRKKRRQQIWTEALEKAREAAAEGKHDNIPRILREAQTEAAAATEKVPEPSNPAALESFLTTFPSGLRFPWPALNALVRADVGMTVVGAATSAGKSTFLYALLLAWLRDDPEGAILFWSGEVAAPLIYARLVSILAGVNMGEVLRQHRERSYTPEVERAKRELGQLFADRVYLLDGPVDADGLAAEARAVARRRRVTAVMVDYLQMLPPPAKVDGGRYANREQEVTATAKALHDLAVELSTVVVAAAQISRNNYQYAMRPKLTDFRESGGIEQYSTTALGLWNSSMVRGVAAAAAGIPPARPENGWYWTPEGVEDSPEALAAMAMAASHGRALLEVSILKSRWRNNVGKSVPLMLNGACGRIEDLPDTRGKEPLPGEKPPVDGDDGGDNGNGDARKKFHNRRRR
ncbi:DnaB-like helicase C-terminal domain-containing protein, partial [Thermodesulfitimonas autotrophica]|uniref:DnaB-like helicase C-terminal domain-containing protein n=1 Tax=Thermodesulfitimonas autotrophica TaxID=1894989 RepID=UPI002FE05B05